MMMFASCPKIPPVNPRTSSRQSGLNFCGISDEPVANAPASLMKPNSLVLKRIKSSDNLLRCVEIKVAIKLNSAERKFSVVFDFDHG